MSHITSGQHTPCLECCKDADNVNFEKFQRKILRQLQFLPEAPPPANAAVYGLLGVKPIEATVDMAMLSLFGNIARDMNCIERELALRQLAVKPFKGTGHDFCWLENPIYHLQKQGNILYI